MNRVANAICGVFVVISSLIGVYGYLHIPADRPIAVHFDLSGTPDGFAPTYMAFLIIPLIGIATLVIVALQSSSIPEGRTVRGGAAIVVIVVQAILCFGQLFILFQELKG
ncbi:DUF1648 domain-containing protein [Pseudoduganella lutea]|nr:DUF1648 domain-containing protein [Pseudoduganella lutea]